jgi:hypothetical protein
MEKSGENLDKHGFKKIGGKILEKILRKRGWVKNDEKKL